MPSLLAPHSKMLFIKLTTPTILAQLHTHAPARTYATSISHNTKERRLVTLSSLSTRSTKGPPLTTLELTQTPSLHSIPPPYRSSLFFATCHVWKIAIIHLWNVPVYCFEPKGMRRRPNSTRASIGEDRQKSYVDRKRKPMEFEVGDKVMLKVSPWKGVVWLELPQEFSRVHTLSPSIKSEGNVTMTTMSCR
ncbi:hypothetical protein Tco_0769981 [Tanacetum coccineum]|uniref:Reverse transcriptase domain-containing protein n=1 Tax=Tanacetum coccineum TaxID=301880 RepID=A0ABQ4ZB78_9ASTR